MRTHRPTPEFPAHLEELYRRFPFERSLADDPLSAVRPLAWDAQRAEIAGIVASTLAVGSARAICGSVRRVAAVVDGDVGRLVDPTRAPERRRRLAPFRHRWIRGEQLDYLFDRLGGLYADGGSLEQVFHDAWAASGFAAGLDALATTLRGGNGSGGARRPPRGYAQLFPSPLDAGASPAKRLTLFVRWMVRSRFPDLGGWRRVPTGELRIPLDQHVHWIAYHLGLTGRRSRSWRTVEEVTESLRRIDPLDPIRYDFVLCHTGISGDCPKERDLSVCGPCSVRPDCRLWRGRGVAQ